MDILSPQSPSFHKQNEERMTRHLSRLALAAYLLIFAAACSDGANGQEKTVEAEDIVERLADGEPVALQNATIVGDLDFTKVAEPYFYLPGAAVVEIDAPFTFVDCTFEGNLVGFKSADGETIKTRFLKNCSFLKCDVKGETIFTQTTIEGETNFAQTSFRKTAFFESADFRNGVVGFSEANFAGEARFQDARFRGAAYFLQAQFAEFASFQTARFNDLAFFGSAKFFGYTDFSRARFEGDADFHYAEFGNKALFNSTLWRVEADFGDSKFNPLGSFENARFDGDAIFDEASVEGEATFLRAEFRGKAPERDDFKLGKNGEILAQGAVTLTKGKALK